MLKILIPAIALLSSTAAFAATNTLYSPTMGLNLGYLVNNQIEKGPYVGLMLGAKRIDCVATGRNELGIQTCIERFSFGPFLDVQGAENGNAWNTGLYLGTSLTGYSLKYTKFNPSKGSLKQPSDRVALVLRVLIFNFEAGVLQENGKELKPSFGFGVGF